MIVSLKSSEFTVGILEDVRDHGHYREVPTISLPSPYISPFPDSIPDKNDNTMSPNILQT